MHARSLRATCVLALAAAPAAAQFAVDASAIPSGSPANASSTENVDFADVDLDGDWDAAFADGGDDGNDQNRIWINAGGLQGGTLGTFVDETGSRFPAVSDDSRDIEFADLDADHDVDIYVSNTSQLANQTNRWWINEGGAQGGTLGTYVDETAARWVGLDAPGTSIPSSALLPGGGFIDWSCDCDFGDLDGDGDLDLAHSTYGGAFGGGVPTRLFLNDGEGFFSEFNPSGFRLAGSNIGNGDPGLWCEGSQLANATDASGASCDIASSALDVDLGDLDGDFDLDLLHGARQEAPRLFSNRYAENGDVLGFRDVTGAAFPSGYSSGNGHYEQEMGDLDGDGDLDIYGLNWQSGFGFNDITLANDGSGTFGGLAVLSGSSADDNEGDFLDYDNDGDLDLYVANFSGQDKLYRNDNDGGSGFSYTQVPLASFSGTSLDADAADVDGDGDYDVLVSMDNFQANVFLRNTTQTPDTTAPSIPSVEVLAGAPAAAGGRRVRAQVYDNAPYYVTWYNPTVLEVTVDGARLPDLPMRSSGGQVFHGEVPGHLVGAVSYAVRSSDEYGNTGLSGTVAYASSGGPVGTLHGTTTPGSLGAPAIQALSLPLPGEDLYLRASNVPPGTPVLFAVSTKQPAAPLDLSNGLVLNVAIPLLVVLPATADTAGDAVLRIAVPPVLSGIPLHFQAIASDGVGGDAFASSQGLRLDFP